MLALLPRVKLADACRPVPVSSPFSAPPDALALAAIDATPIDVPRLKQAIELVHRGKPREVAEIQRGVHDPVVKKLIEWIVLRSEEGQAGFDRYAVFIRENPAWPGLSVLRKRAEAALWQEKRDSRTVLGFLQGKPISANGRLAFARALLSEGDRADAEREIRETWRSEELSPRLEEEILAVFPGVLTRDDHAARMDRRIGRKEFSTAMRAALRLGPSYTAVVKACAAVAGKDKKARELLDKVAAELRPNLGYVLCRVQWALDHDDAAQAARLVLDAPHEPMIWQDTDQWWRERRVIARKLLDVGDVRAAYQVVRDAARPRDEFYRAEAHFMAGWIALRFLQEPATALTHFAHIDDGTSNPVVLARARYWRGRAAEGLGMIAHARDHYVAAAGYPTAYYGQLARAKLGMGDVAPDELPQPSAVRRDPAGAEIVRAAELLYWLGERKLGLRFAAELGDGSEDATAVSAVAELTLDQEDPQATLLLGKAALGRGLEAVPYAFPARGLPVYEPKGPRLDPSIAYAVMRTESGFDPRDLSPANAVGLMQVTPEAGRDTAKRFGLPFDWHRMVCDQVYNTQMGAAELAGLLGEYRGSLILIFAGYNAGRGRIEQWIAKYGDPRNPNVDPVDWVERIPFAETRNYVQRVMEALQVYRALLGNRARPEAMPRAGMPVETISIR